MDKISGDARAIHEMAGKIAAEFPPGSMQPPTAAKPMIWQQWDDFTEKAKKLESEVAKLSATGAAAADGLRTQFRAVAYACDGCHETYRVPKTNR